MACSSRSLSERSSAAARPHPPRVRAPPRGAGDRHRPEPVPVDPGQPLRGRAEERPAAAREQVRGALRGPCCERRPGPLRCPGTPAAPCPAGAPGPPCPAVRGPPRPPSGRPGAPTPPGPAGSSGDRPAAPTGRAAAVASRRALPAAATSLAQVASSSAARASAPSGASATVSVATPRRSPAPARAAPGRRPGTGVQGSSAPGPGAVNPSAPSSTGPAGSPGRRRRDRRGRSSPTPLPRSRTGRRRPARWTRRGRCPRSASPSDGRSQQAVSALPPAPHGPGPPDRPGGRPGWPSERRAPRRHAGEVRRAAEMAPARVPGRASREASRAGLREAARRRGRLDGRHARLRHPHAAQEHRPQRWVRVLQAARPLRHQPAPHHLVERTEPGDADDPGVDGRDRPPRRSPGPGSPR